MPELISAGDGRVHASYWRITENGTYLGAITLRHELNDFLLRAGGHIGYGIRPSARGRGLATWATAGDLSRGGTRSPPIRPSLPAGNGEPAGGSTGQRANRVFDRRICPVRSASMAGRRQGPAGVDVSVPNVARMYDYWLGGKDNFAADREAAERSVELVPQLPWLARENRRFLGRAVRFCADAGITQFLDIGSGLPTNQNVHQVAEQVIADPRVVYVDNDPVVVSHAQALLATPRTTAVQGDLTRPDEILNDPEIRRLIDLSKPVCLLLVAILHYISDDFDTHGCVARLREAMAPGSYLVITHSDISPAHVADNEPLTDTARELRAVLDETPLGPVRNREEIAAYFGDLTLVEPGLVDVWDWRPDSEVVVNPSDFLTVLAGVARKD